MQFTYIIRDPVEEGKFQSRGTASMRGIERVQPDWLVRAYATVDYRRDKRRLPKFGGEEIIAAHDAFYAELNQQYKNVLSWGDAMCGNV